MAQGTPQLSAGARCLLAFYASHLPLDAPEKTSVFPGTERATACLGISPATLRRHKAELEDVGFIIRCYDQRNRPLERGAIDLRPLLAKVPSIVSGLNSDRNAQVEAWRKSRSPDEPSDMSTQVLTLELLNSTKKSSENSSFNDCEMKGGEPAPPSALDPSTSGEDRELIDQVLAFSPKLRVALPGGFDGETAEPTAQLRAVLPSLFPQETAASIGHTGLWAEQRLGAAMFAAVAIAVEDPDVRRPAAYFGHLVTRAEGYDPGDNLKRLAQLNPAPVELERHGDPVADRVVDLLATEIGIPSAASWFGPGCARIVIEDEILRIEPATRFGAQRIKERYEAPLAVVARRVGAKALRILAPGEAVCALSP